MGMKLPGKTGIFKMVIFRIEISMNNEQKTDTRKQVI